MPDSSPLRIPDEDRLFTELMELPAEERPAFLEHRFGNDRTTAARLLALCHSYVERSSFLETPAAEDALSMGAGAGHFLPHDPAPGDRIGRYRLVERIGSGGFGVVFSAEQEEPVRRHVAVKIMRLGLDTREFVARFEAERQALALMDHPHIARVFDAGATDTGRPYLVMELVRGLPITKYCDEHRLPLRERLELFIAVCGAIQHAHQKGVIHRDLKPSNILVARDAGATVPKVIDFGIAKAVSGPLTEKTLVTIHHSVIGTPAYASPEQMEFAVRDVDTRSDLYSLGALLYELLTGCPPFDRTELEQSGFDAMRRTIREIEPARPSVRVGGLTRAERSLVSERRGAPPEKLSALLASDLDWIVMRCLEKDRARRYETANALALDIRRHLDNEPVVARPPSRGYRLRKYIRRHRTPVFAAAAVAVSLVGGLIGTGGLLVREKAAAEKSRQVAQFMKAMLGSVGPSVARGRDTTLLREVLDDTIRRLDTDLRDQPEVAADLRHTLGIAFREIGEYERAATLWRDAIAARRALGDRTSAELAATLHELGSLLWRMNEVEAAERALEEALAIRRRTLGPDHFEVGATLAAVSYNLGSQRSTQEREALLREAVAIQRKIPGRDEEFAQTLIMDGYMLAAANHYDEADTVLREAVALCRRVHGGNVHPRLAEALEMRAYAILMRGVENSEELQLRREALQIVRQVRGLANAKLVAALLGFATCRFPAETLDADLRLAREVLADLTDALPADSADLAVARIALASMLDLDPGRAAEAEALAREGVAQLRSAREKGRSPHRDTVVAIQNFTLRLHEDGRLRYARPMAEELNNDTRVGSVQRYGPPIARFLGYIYHDLGDYDKALSLLEHSALSQKAPERPMWRPVQRAHLLVDYAYWGDTLRKVGRIADSRRVLEMGLDRKFDQRTDDPAERARAVVRGELGYTALAEGKFTEAEKWFRAALQEYERGPAPNRWQDLRPCGRVRLGFGLALAGQRKFAEAEREVVAGFEELLAKRKTFWGDPTLMLREAHEAVVRFYREWGRPEKAAEWEAKRPTW